MTFQTKVKEKAIFYAYIGTVAVPVTLTCLLAGCAFGLGFLSYLIGQLYYGKTTENEIVYRGLLKGDI